MGTRVRKEKNMAGFSIEKSKQKITDIKREVGVKKEKLEDLETSKQEALSVITELSGANISEEAKTKSAEVLKAELEKISAQGQELSDQIGEDTKEYETEIQEIQTVCDNNAEELKKVEDKKSLLSKINMGELMDSTIQELQNEEMQLNELSQAAIDARKESEDLSKRASLL